MSAARLVVVVLWVAVTAYAVFGGADFGAGFWDLTAGGPRQGRARRALIDHSIGAVWETNHVWLIFVLVLLWTCFPTAFSSIMSTLYIPLTLVTIGIIFRGAGFAFRHTVSEVPSQRLFGASFAISSVLTPFFLGCVAGAVATGRVPVGNAAGDPISSWWNPTSILGGTLAVAVCAFTSAVFLLHDAVRLDPADADDPHDPAGAGSEGDNLALITHHRDELVADFRTRSLAVAVVTGIIAFAGIFILRADAPQLFDGLTGTALPLVLLSAAGGLATIVLIRMDQVSRARIAAVVAVAAVIWGWGVAQFPYLIEGTLTLDQAAAPTATLTAVAIVAVLGLVLLIPSIFLLYTLADRDLLEEAHVDE